MKVYVPRDVELFIRSCDKNTVGKIVRLIRLLETFGHILSMPHARHVEGAIWELRIRGKQEVRLFYGFSPDSVAVIVHGFIKKTQKTPRREIDYALQTWRQLTEI